MTRTPKVPDHHSTARLLPLFTPGRFHLETPAGVYVVEMVRREPDRWHRAEYYWQIVSQPVGRLASTTGARPSYGAGVDPDSSSYNEYHRAINFLEDSLYAKQQRSA